MFERNARARVAPVPRGRRAVSGADLQRRRLRNRENMRRLRENPAYRALERRRRSQKWDDATSRRFVESMANETKPDLETHSRCAICRKRKAVEIITRLRPSAETKSGFVQMRIAYCGFC